MRLVAGWVFAGLVLTGCAAGPTDTPRDAGAETGQRGFLAGLMSPPETQSEPETSSKRPKLPAPLEQASFAEGLITVAGPSGYCIDPITLDTGRNRGFAVIASCRILSGGAQGGVVEPALITVTLGPRMRKGSLPEPQDLAELAEATLLGGREAADIVLAHVRADTPDILENRDIRYWRGAFESQGRLIGLALFAPDKSPLAGAGGADVLVQTAARIRALSDTEPAVSSPDRPASETRRAGGLLGRLFDR